mmetsp:Transcript_59893/g.106522  ORF Transcript_59893/g.106522 Transcript_59893/m.106522 type:complete len:345 (+) Transcript_59893:100-1134(+)
MTGTFLFLHAASKLPVVGKGRHWMGIVHETGPIGRFSAGLSSWLSSAATNAGLPHPGLAALPAALDAALTFAVLFAAVANMWGIAYLARNDVLDKEVLTLTLSLACPLITIASYVAPTPMVLAAVRKMNAQDLPMLVVQSQAACNVLGIAYALQITNAAVLVTNMFGLACQILFLTGEHYVRLYNTQWFWFSIKLTTLLNVGICFFSQLVPVNLLGQCITVFNLALYASPLTKLGGVLRTRNSSAFPPVMTSISVANNAFWTLYALLIEDPVVLLPSLLGLLASSLQVLAILWCRHFLPFDLKFLLLFFGGKGDGDEKAIYDYDEEASESHEVELQKNESDRWL